MARSSSTATMLFIIQSGCAPPNGAQPKQPSLGPPRTCDHIVVLPDQYYSGTETTALLPTDAATIEITTIHSGSTISMYNDVAFYASDHPRGVTEWWMNEYYLYDSSGLLVSHRAQLVRNGILSTTGTEPASVATIGRLDDVGEVHEGPRIGTQAFSLVIRSSEQGRPECFAEIAFLDIRIDDVRGIYGFYAQSPDISRWYPVIDPPTPDPATKPGPGHDTAAAEDSGR